MDKEKLKKVEDAVADNILYFAERAATAAEVEALAAIVQAFSNLRSSRTSERAGQQESE